MNWNYRAQGQNRSGYGGGGRYTPYVFNGRGNGYPVNSGGRGSGKKRSGGRKGVGKNGKPWVNGWNIRARQLVSYFAFPYKGTHTGTSKNGKVWENWMLKITSGIQERLCPCLFYPATGKIVCQDMGIVINPSVNYCGTYVRRKGR